MDGVAYRSASGEGHNIALFDLDSARVRVGGLIEVKDVTFNFVQASESYYVTT